MGTADTCFSFHLAISEDSQAYHGGLAKNETLFLLLSANIYWEPTSACFGVQCFILSSKHPHDTGTIISFFRLIKKQTAPDLVNNSLRKKKGGGVRASIWPKI